MLSRFGTKHFHQSRSGIVAQCISVVVIVVIFISRGYRRRFPKGPPRSDDWDAHRDGDEWNAIEQKCFQVSKSPVGGNSWLAGIDYGHYDNLCADDASGYKIRPRAGRLSLVRNWRANRSSASLEMFT
jgi:hypothetical protein